VQSTKPRRRRRRQRARKLSFVPVVVGKTRSTEASTIIEVVLSNNLRARVAAGIAETDLVRIVRALGGV
jgi:hypothetical protein